MGKNDFGGKIECRFSDGTILSLRGTMAIMTAGVSVEAVTNQDATVDRVSTPQPRRFEMTFADRGLDMHRLMTGERFDVTFLERDNGVTHYFTSCFLTGDPSTDRRTGEVTGVSGAAESYARKG